MPEKVTREEKIIELAIAKAREVKALRDGLTKDEMPTIEKVKRPKAKASKHGIKQDKVHANAGGEEFTSGKIKKMTNEEIAAEERLMTGYVHLLDAQIAKKEKQFKGKKMNAEERATLNKMKTRVEEIYKVLTLMKSQKYKSSEKMAKFNEATDKENDPRDVKFSREGKESADEAFENINATIKNVTSKLLTATGNELGKLESDLAEAVSDLKELSVYFGRS